MVLVLNPDRFGSNLCVFLRTLHTGDPDPDPLTWCWSCSSRWTPGWAAGPSPIWRQPELQNNNISTASWWAARPGPASEPRQSTQNQTKQNQNQCPDYILIQCIRNEPRAPDQNISRGQTRVHSDPLRSISFHRNPKIDPSEIQNQNREDIPLSAAGGGGGSGGVTAAPEWNNEVRMDKQNQMIRCVKDDRSQTGRDDRTSHTKQVQVPETGPAGQNTARLGPADPDPQIRSLWNTSADRYSQTCSRGTAADAEGAGAGSAQAPPTYTEPRPQLCWLVAPRVSSRISAVNQRKRIRILKLFLLEIFN